MPVFHAHIRKGQFPRQQKICRQLGDAADIRPDDVFIALIPVPIENVSFGRGVAQLASAAPRW